MMNQNLIRRRTFRFPCHFRYHCFLLSLISCSLVILIFSSSCPCFQRRIPSFSCHTSSIKKLLISLFINKISKLKTFVNLISGMSFVGFSKDFQVKSLFTFSLAYCSSYFSLSSLETFFHIFPNFFAISVTPAPLFSFVTSALWS